MGSEISAAIHFTMHPSGVWSRVGDVETYRGPCDTRVVITSGVPGLSELTHFAFHTVSFTRPAAPAPSSSSEEEDPEEGSTPPSSPQFMPMTEDLPESSYRGAPFDQTSAHPAADQCGSPWLYPECLSFMEAARLGVAHIDWTAEMRLPQGDLTFTPEQTPPLAVFPISAVPVDDASEPMLSPEPEQPHYMTDESEELEVEFAEDVPEHVEVHSPVYVPADYPSDEEEEEEDAVPDSPVYIPGADDSEDEVDDEEMDELGFGDVPDFVDFDDAAEWELDDGGDFPLDSDDEMISCITSESSSSSSDFGPGW